MMRLKNVLWLVVLLMVSCRDDETVNPVDGPVAVEKTNSTKLYMHYMPWFQSKEISGFWGSHWRMNTRNPENIDSNGRREIASHYYPLIGPYDSKDPDVIEYHLLLMKYAGIDVVLLDWYGIHTVNDYNNIFKASQALVELLDDVGLQFAIVYEEFTAESVADRKNITPIQAAKSDLKFLEQEYFSMAEYAKVNNAPLLMTFGPRFFKEPSQWTELFSAIESKPTFLPLWDHSSAVGQNADGEYAWIDFTSSLSGLSSFYSKQAYMDVIMGSAYPRFHDYYVEGGWGGSYGFVDDNNGQTMSNTLEMANDHQASHLQLVTWNDFGEGTVIEPTLEDRFKFLELIQGFSGVSYGTDELELIHEYYLAKKKFKGKKEELDKLKEAFKLLAALDLNGARKIIEELQ